MEEKGQRIDNFTQGNWLILQTSKERPRYFSLGLYQIIGCCRPEEKVNLEIVFNLPS